MIWTHFKILQGSSRYSNRTLDPLEWDRNFEVFYTAHHAVQPEVSAGIIDELQKKQKKKESVESVESVHGFFG